MGHPKTAQPDPALKAARDARRRELSQNPDMAVDVPDAALFFDVAESTFKFLCRAGRAPRGFLVGRRRRFYVRDLVNFYATASK